VEKCERGGGCFIGGLSSQCGLDYIVNRIDSHSIILNKTTLIFRPSMPLERIKTAIKGGVTSYPYLPLRNPLGRAVGGILVPTRSQSIPVHS
jgi:hypothetical protein